MTPKASHTDVLAKVREVIDSNTIDPATELQAMGRALSEIGKALDGLSLQEARSVIEAVMALDGYQPRF